MLFYLHYLGAYNVRRRWRQKPKSRNVSYQITSPADYRYNCIEVFNIPGYKAETNSSLESVFEKIALYIDADGLPSHAARQKENGFWTSKLGEAEDIEHDTPDALEGETYGKVKIILKRPRKV